MYSYEWDIETGGLVLNSSPLSFSKEPRPVYYKELDVLGFDEHWHYDKNDMYPYMWAEANNYWYRGRLVAKTQGGTLYTAPKILLLEEPEPNNEPLRFIDIPGMVEKNKDLMEKLSQATIKKIYNTFIEYKNRVDVFYVAFSGGKDSIVTLDLVQRTLPHNDFKVLFGDTGMEFPDTYNAVDIIEKECREKDIEFLRAKSVLSSESTWKQFGPPAVTNRWCCSVHKTSPQIMLLQEQTKKNGFTGMAFTGIRGDESASRSEYEDVSNGNKHQGQYSCHPILEWNSAELYNYIFQEQLMINEAYKKGNTRAGCLVCPMSSGKHEYMKHKCYPNEVLPFIESIKNTSGKTNFTDEEMLDFIDSGFWKTRKSGRELNLGQDKHLVEIDKNKTTIKTYLHNERWKEWAKTIGNFQQVNENQYIISYIDKEYLVLECKSQNENIYSFPNATNSKQDIKFISLFRSVIVKSIYCNSCGVCVAECTNGCISMKSKLAISDKCTHCYQCHSIHEHCLRYNSIKNKIGAEKSMKGLDRYFSFGVRRQWLEAYFKEEGSVRFWDTDGQGYVPNKKKDAFLNFLKDAELVVLNKAIGHDKYTKYEPSHLAKKIFSYGCESEVTWAMALCNLVYTSQFNWFVKNIKPGQQNTLEQLKFMLDDVMENDTKGLGKRNITDAFKIFLIKTPLGNELGLGVCDYTEKISSSGTETITLNYFTRSAWQNPDPLVILYSLYKFAENCGDYYQFTISRLLNHEIESDGVSPTEIFGLDREQMEKISQGLSINYPEFISASFTLDLDNITLRSDKTSDDVLELF